MFHDAELRELGNLATISEVVRGPSRKKSRIDRRVSSPRAFQT